MNVPKNMNVLTFLQQSETDIIAPCNGKGICGKCKVMIPSGPMPNDIEKQLLRDSELKNNVRLACTRTTNEATEIINLSDQLITNITSDYSLNFIFDPYITIQKENEQYKIYRNNEFLTEKNTPHAFGIAIDIGTTTVVLVLFNITTQLPIDKRSFLNPQSKYGSDVISRIQFASNKENLKLISDLIRKKLDQAIAELLKQNGIVYSDLFEVIISGNTTMTHLLLQFDPSPMAKAPYKTPYLDTYYLSYDSVFPTNIKANVTILGAFDSFVGGDILSGIYSEDLHKSQSYNLLVDLGTNGEIALVNKDNVYCSSTAAGPAFEGVNISSGIGAVNGAISRYYDTNQYETINGLHPIGICGSGLIDLVSVLLDQDIIEPSGRMNKEYIITSSISLEPKDVRELQLAKAAIRAGIEYLLDVAKIEVEKIDTLYISGGFGKHINLNHLFRLGIIPKELQPKSKVIGNSSLSGAIKYLFQSTHDELDKLKSKCEIVNLGTSLKFQDLFVKYIPFD